MIWHWYSYSLTSPQPSVWASQWSTAINVSLGVLFLSSKAFDFLFVCGHWVLPHSVWAMVYIMLFVSLEWTQLDTQPSGTDTHTQIHKKKKSLLLWTESAMSVRVHECHSMTAHLCMYLCTRAAFHFLFNLICMFVCDWKCVCVCAWSVYASFMCISSLNKQLLRFLFTISSFHIRLPRTELSS